MIIPTGELQPGARKRQHTDAIQGAIKTGVPHLIYISMVGARPDPDNELFDSHFTTGHGAHPVGSRVELDGANRAIASGTYSAVPGAPAAYVVRDDIAGPTAGILATPGHEGITYHATGPYR